MGKCKECGRETDFQVMPARKRSAKWLYYLCEKPCYERVVAEHKAAQARWKAANPCQVEGCSNIMRYRVGYAPSAGLCARHKKKAWVHFSHYGILAGLAGITGQDILAHFKGSVENNVE